MEWEAILLPFASSLWAAVGLVVTSCSFSLAATYRLTAPPGSENVRDLRLVTASLLSFGIFCQQGKQLCFFCHQGKQICFFCQQDKQICVSSVSKVSKFVSSVSKVSKFVSFVSNVSKFVSSLSKISKFVFLLSAR
jgi:hypothetical protein